MSDKQRKWMVRIFAMVMALILLASAIAPLFMTVNAGRVDELQDSINALKQEQKQIEAQIAGVKGEKAKQAQYLTVLQQQVTNTNAQIQVLNEQIDSVNGEIQTIQDQITQITQEQQDTIDRFRQRVRSAYMGDDSSVMNLLTSSQSFSDVLISTEFMENASAYDNRLVTELKAAAEEMQTKRAEQQTKLDELQGKKDELAVMKADLTAQTNQVSALKAELEGNEAALRAESQRLLEQQWANQAEIAEIVGNNNNSTDYVGGEFIWPVGGSTYISSYYGPRYIQGIYDNHTGIDITGGGIYGRDIHASNSGRVVYVRNYTTGYGKHLLIDHGGGKYTLYAHTSAVLVSEGQWVTQGQTIARVGSTGWSTGPHLHFEIWINGKHTNPLPYLP